MTNPPTPERLEEWTSTAQELALENWDDAKIAAHLRKRGCESGLAEAITKQVQKSARRHGRKAGLISIITGFAILLGFAVMILGFAGSGVAVFAPKLGLLALAAVGLIFYGFCQLLFG
jgi:hypothetical protein